MSDLKITADENIPAISMSRSFNAPASLVFKAFADPEIFARWVGPDTTSTDVVNWDFRTGGSWRYDAVMNGEHYPFQGSFHSVDEGKAIVQTFEFLGFPGAVSLESMTFEDTGNGQSRIVQRSIFQEFAHRDGMLQSDMETGVREGYDKLDAVLAELAAS